MTTELPATDQNTSEQRNDLLTFLWVTFGRILLLGSWFYATKCFANVIGPAAFGMYVLCQSTIRVLTGSIGDPLDMAVMREAPLLLRTDRRGALDLIRSAFWLRVAFGVVVILVALSVPSLASRAIFNSPQFRGLAVLTLAGVLGDFLLRSVLGFFQVSEQFSRFMLVDAVWQLGRVAAVSILAVTHHLTAPAGIVLYVVAPYVSAFCGWFLLPPDMTRLAPPSRYQIVKILDYTKWIVAGMSMAAAYERLDLFMLEWIRTRHDHGHDVGIYGLAGFLASIPDYLNGIIQTSLAPKVAPAYADGTFNRLQWWYLKYAVPCGLLMGAGAILLSSWGIRTFLSPQYIDAIPVFKILILSTLFNLVFTPLPSALVNFVAPQRVTVFTAVGLVWVAVGAAFAIPMYHATGAAVVMLTARLVVGLLIIIQAQRLSRRPGITNAVPLTAELPGHMEEQV
jgi:O-antigen/teichoic acid export membrane protein